MHQEPTQGLYCHRLLRKGTIIGTQTYGKGIVQTVKPLTDGSAIKFTIAKYFTPKGQDIHGKGEDVRPMVEQQTTAVQLQKDIHTRAEQVNHKEDPNNRQKKFDAKDKSDNEYQSGHKERKNQTSEDGKVFIKDLFCTLSVTA